MATPRSKASNEKTVSHSLISARRVTKVNKGKKRMYIAALVVASDGSGGVGYGTGKAQDAAAAKNKAIRAAIDNIIKFPIYQGSTIHQDVEGKSGASLVKIKKAPAGTGIISSDSTRPIFALAGILNVVVKSLGSTNPYTLIPAVFNGLQKLESPRSIAERRSKKPSDLSTYSAVSITKIKESNTNDA
jgi:small subunit ribosomal protein S5